MGQATVGGVYEALDAGFWTLAGHEDSGMMPGDLRVDGSAGTGAWVRGVAWVAGAWAGCRETARSGNGPSVGRVHVHGMRAARRWGVAATPSPGEWFGDRLGARPCERAGSTV